MGDATRPTMDVDLLGFGDTSAEALKHIFVALCEVDRQHRSRPATVIFVLGARDVRILRQQLRGLFDPTHAARDHHGNGISYLR